MCASNGILKAASTVGSFYRPFNRDKIGMRLNDTIQLVQYTFCVWSTFSSHWCGHKMTLPMTWCLGIAAVTRVRTQQTRCDTTSQTYCEGNVARLTRVSRDVTRRQMIYARRSDDYCRLMNTLWSMVASDSQVWFVWQAPTDKYVVVIAFWC